MKRAGIIFLAALMLCCNVFAAASAGATELKIYERFENEFIGESEVADDGVFYGTDWYCYSHDKFTYPVGVTGLGGNETQSLAIVAGDPGNNTTVHTPTSGLDPWWQHDIGDMSDVFTTEFSLYVYGDDMTMGRLTWREEFSEEGAADFRINNDYSMTIGMRGGSQTGIGTLEEGVWTKLAVTLDTVSGTADVRINGELVIQGVSVCNPGTSYDAIKMMALYPADTDVMGCLAVDDFSVYNGEYDETAPSSIVRLGVDEFDVYDIPAFDSEQLRELNINVSVEGEPLEIGRIDAFVNGQFKCSLTEEPYIIDLSDSSNGTNVLTLNAFDIEGNLVAEYEKQFALVSMDMNLVYESDFSNDAGEMDMQNIANKGGRYEFLQIDSSYGKSLLISSDEKSNIADIGPFGAVSLPSATASYETDLDFCVLDDSAAFLLQMRASNISTQLKVVRFTNDGRVDLLGSGGRLGENRLETYEKGRWYNVRMVFYGASKTYDLYIDGELQVSGRTAENSSSLEQGVSQVRIVMENYENADGSVSEGRVAVDNMRVYRLQPSLYVTGVSSTAGGSAVEPDAERLYVSLNGSISDYNLSNYIKLDCDMGSIPIESISYDSASNTLELTLGAKLRSSVEYVITLCRGMFIDNGELDIDIYGRFTVAPDELDITRVSFETRGTEVSAAAQYVNSTSDSKEVKAVINIWKEGVLQRSSAENIMLEAGGGSVPVGSYVLSEGESLEIHFVEFFDMYSPVTVNTYEYIMN